MYLNKISCVDCMCFCGCFIVVFACNIALLDLGVASAPMDCVVGASTPVGCVVDSSTPVDCAVGASSVFLLALLLCE